MCVGLDGTDDVLGTGLDDALTPTAGDTMSVVECFFTCAYSTGGLRTKQLSPSMRSMDRLRFSGISSCLFTGLDFVE